MYRTDPRILIPKGFHNTVQGALSTLSAPWVVQESATSTLKGLHLRVEPIQGSRDFFSSFPRVRHDDVATLGCAVKPRWGNDSRINSAYQPSPDRQGAVLGESQGQAPQSLWCQAVLTPKGFDNTAQGR